MDVVPGTASTSFGINAAKLAGIPNSVLQLAKQRAEWMKQKYGAGS